MTRTALTLPILVLATGCGGWGSEPDFAGDASISDGSSSDPTLADAGHSPGPDAAPDAEAGPPPASLNDYWNGRARWRLDRGLTLAATGWPYGYGAGAHITVTKDAWYLFGRKLAPRSK